ncbi:hypothetical protein BJ170DRAFT_463408 [Xylariales sp. AK1849]|nr:hypothetical protein BJ170DRAFT_463408 [Xylariales sp. AK1849]
MPQVRHQHGSRRPREAVESRSHLAGFIASLPPRSAPDDGINLDEGCYKHPVVIISPQLQETKVVVLILTSFKSVNLEIKHRGNRHARLKYLPIKPCDPHPDHGLLLSLENPSLELRKRSYVNTRDHHTVEFNSLLPYERAGRDYALSRDSYQVLLDYAKFPTPVPRPQAAIRPGSIDSSHNINLHNHGMRAISSIAPRAPTVHPIAEVVWGTSAVVQLQARDSASRAREAQARAQQQRRLWHVLNGPNVTPDDSWHQQAERLNLLGEHPRPLRRSYGSIPTHNGSGRHYASRSSGGGSSRNWNIAKAVLWILCVLLAGYIVYRSVCWTVALVNTTVERVKHGVEVIGDWFMDIFVMAPKAFGEKIMGSWVGSWGA